MSAPPLSRPPTQAVRYAAILSGAYVVVGTLYIVSSSQLAAAMAASVTDLEQLERFKGIAFVLVTGALLFALGSVLFARVERSGAQLTRAHEALARVERHATAGLLASSIAHDFNNLLTVLRGSLDLLGDASPAVRAEVLDDARDALRQASELARRLSREGSHAASSRGREAVDVRALAEDTVALMRLHPRARGKELRVDGEACVLAEGHAGPIRQMLNNLVLNAIEASPPRGRVRVAVKDAPGGAVQIVVDDDGPGVDPAIVPRLFDPFFTTKAEGTGLGLMSVRAAADLHRGAVAVDRSPDLGGARFTVRLGHQGSPASQGTASAA